MKVKRVFVKVKTKVKFKQVAIALLKERAH